MDAYLRTATNEQVGNDGQDQGQGPLPHPVMQVVRAFNLGHPINQIAKQWAIDESRVLVNLLQAEDKGHIIQWSCMTVSACLKDAVEIAAEVARHLEKAAMEQQGAMGGAAGQRKEPLSTRFPLPVLMQLLPDWRPVDVLAGICLVRHQRQTRLSARRRRVPPGGAAATTGTTTTAAAAVMAKTGQTGISTATLVSGMGGVKRPAESMVVVNDENQGPRSTAYASSSKDATKQMQQQHQEEQPRRAFSPFAQQQSQQQQHQQQTQPVIDKPTYAPAMHQHQHQQHQQQQRQQHPQPPSNPPASVVPLPTRIMTLLQAHAANGLSSAECFELLASAARSHHHALDSKTQAAVDACLGELEESYVAYRGADGKFKLL